jgi:hypothetical protein
LDARADDTGELAARSLNLSGSGDPHQRRLRARVGGGSPASGQYSGNGKRSYQPIKRRCRHANILHVGIEGQLRRPRLERALSTPSTAGGR